MTEQDLQRIPGGRPRQVDDDLWAAIKRDLTRHQGTETLPYPPTVNTYWRHIIDRGRQKVLISKAGRDYATAVESIWALRVRRTLSCRLSVEITAHAGDKRTRDLDNITKSLLDAMTKAGFWEDDGQIDRLLIQRGAICKGNPHVVVRWEEIE